MKKVIKFAPEQWGSLQFFLYFHYETFQLGPKSKRALSGALDHYWKAKLLQNLAVQQADRMDEDRAQLEEHGFTRAVVNDNYTSPPATITLPYCLVATDG